MRKTRPLVALELAHGGQSGGNPLDEALLPDCLGIDVAPSSQQLGAVADHPVRVAGGQRPVVFAHRHADDDDDDL